MRVCVCLCLRERERERERERDQQRERERERERERDEAGFPAALSGDFDPKPSKSTTRFDHVEMGVYTCSRRSDAAT
jgi:hypothetical protein